MSAADRLIGKAPDYEVLAACHSGREALAGTRKLLLATEARRIIDAMKVRRVACVIRGGHRWETTTDVVGSTTTCARCGKISHKRMSGLGGSSAFGVAEDAAMDFEGRNRLP